MGSRKFVSKACAAGLCAGAAMAFAGSQAASASSSAVTAVPGTAAPAAAKAHPAGAVSASSGVKFSVVLKLSDQAGAEALLRAISTPGSSTYHQYLTAAQWEARFSPTTDQVNQVKAWLSSEGFSVGAVSADRLTIAASGTAAQVESAFSTGLQNYQVAGHTVRMATSDLSVPSSLSGVIAGALGINQHVARPAAASVGNPDIPGSSSAGSGAASSNGKFPPAPNAFLPAPPCSAYYGEKTRTLNPPFGNGYPGTVPDVVCGYKPGQYRSAYGVTSAATGKGATVAIIDAYGSSTIESDASQYFNQNDPGNHFSKAHFTQINATPFQNEDVCAASSWLVEQAIDVEAVHSTAPDANILYVGAKDCFDNNLLAAEQNVIDNHLADVVTNSWGDPAGDVLVDNATKAAYDDEFLLAGSTGITVQFSSGDDGDNFNLTGISAPNYPASSPVDTAVGGTTLKIGRNGQRIGEVGWATGRSRLCTANIQPFFGCTLNTWTPATENGVSGGYTSYTYLQPSYQAGIVPTDLAERNAPIFGSQALRVIPDISADADPGTGFLIGLHQTLPDGTSQYTQTRFGGTSLASPLLAGMVADADQIAPAPVGFMNPIIYGLDVTQPSTIYDVVPSATLEGNFRRDNAGATGVGLPTGGSADSFRELFYSGPEVYCDATGNCASRPQTLTAGPGYDGLTGLGSPGTGFISALAAGS
jgi:subtilase family serine protease